MPTLARRHLLAGASATTAVAAIPAAAAIEAEAPTIAGREETLSMIVSRINQGNQATGLVPQSGILSFGGRRICIMDPKFKNEAEIFLFGDAAQDKWRLED